MAHNYLVGTSEIIANSFKFAFSQHLASLYVKEVPELRVMAWNCPPFLYGIKLFDALVNNSTKEFVHISGPLYSLVKEAALRMNYSLVVQWSETDENIYSRFLTFMPHLLVYPWVYSTGFIEDVGFMTECKRLPVLFN